MTKLPRFRLKPLAISLAALGLAACGGTGQDVERAKSFSQEFSGVAVDGHLARSLVFFDYDNNGTRSPWEPSAYTDNQGYYSYNPNTNTDYCADPEAETALYCLRSDREKENVVIRVDGGYDIVTGEPFHGQLSRRIHVSAGEAIASAVISPLTSVLSDVLDEQDKQALLTALGITETDLNIDYLNSDGNGGVAPALFNKAVKLHKINNLMAGAVEDHYRDVLEEPGTPNDLSASIYRHIGKQLLAANTDFEQAVANSAFIAKVLSATEADAHELYRKRDMVLPNGTGTLVESGASSLVDSQRTHARVDAMARVINALLPANEPTHMDNLQGRVRAIEAVMLKGRKYTSSSDTEINAALTFFTDPLNKDNVDRLATALSQADADLSALVRNDFSGDSLRSEEGINAAVRLPPGAKAFRNVAGMQFRIADMDLGNGPNDLQDSEVEAYFLGGANATEGRLIACVKHIRDASSDGKLGEGSTRGERVKGQWSLLSPNAEDGSAYSMILTLNFLGSSYQAIMKSAGNQEVNGSSMQLVRFDYAGDISSWHSEAGLEAQAGMPANNKDCENRLPSRVGL